MRNCTLCCSHIRPTCVYYNFENFTFSWSATFSPSPTSRSTESLAQEGRPVRPVRPVRPSFGLHSYSNDRRSRSRQHRTAERRTHRHPWSRRSLSHSVILPNKRRVSIASFRSAAETEAPRSLVDVPLVVRNMSETKTETKTK